jgi:hypothetical protein
MGPRPPFSVRRTYTILTRIPTDGAVRLQAHRQIVVQALRHSAATWDQVSAAVIAFFGCVGRV